MTYVLTFIVGFTLGYLVEGFRDMLTDRRIEEDEEEYIQITEKGLQWLKDKDNDTESID